MMNSELKEVKTYLVEKFFPPRCPQCEHAFKGKEDFATFFGKNNPAKSYATALANWMKRWPEIWQTGTTSTNQPFTKSVEYFSGNPYQFDFISCSQCNNVTIRITYATRNVMSREEAERLVEKEGFTSILEAISSGTMAKPYTKLSWLAKMDLLILENAVRVGREDARHEKDEGIAGDIFAATVDKALSEIIKKNSEAAQHNQVINYLREIFGTYWETLDPDARNSLITAELLNYQLNSLVENSVSADYAAVVVSYSRALERTLLLKVFNKFKESPFSKQFPSPTGDRKIDQSIEALYGFVEMGKDITLGQMAYCITNIGGNIRKNDGNGFALFLMEQTGNLDEFIDVENFPSRLKKYVMNFRNKSAHVDKITKQECEKARAYLLDEPVQLLILVEKTFNKT